MRKVKPRALSALVILIVGCIAFFFAFQGERDATGIIPETGMLQLDILNDECKALSPDESSQFNPNPATLNDGFLDDIERRAIDVGCTLRVTAIAPNGMRLTDIPILLLRSDATSGAFEEFGGPRRTDAYGEARWSFFLTPNTHFMYEGISPNPVKQAVTSNMIEIQLCIGQDSAVDISGRSIADSGLGCPAE